MPAVQYQDRTFDREVRYDDRSLNFPVTATLRADEPRSYTWSCKPVLDQGREGACVGFSLAHEFAARPKVHPVDATLARTIYTEAQRIDEWAGEDYDGTSVLAGLKVAQRMGYIKGYRWAFSLNDALVGVSRKGPGVLGTWWWSGMFEPDADGFLRPTGDRIGGHAILVNSVSLKGGYVKVHNSWGPDWGRNGEAKILFDDFEKLLMEDGELAFPERL